VLLLKQLGEKVEQWTHKVSRTINLLGVAVLFLMMLVVAADVIGRYVFNRPLTGAFDTVELMMVILVFFSLAYCAAADGHVRVDVLHSRLPKRIQANLDSITFAASAFIVGLIFWRLVTRAGGVFLEAPGPSTLPATLTLKIPHWPFIFLAAAGSLLFCLELLIYFFHSLTRAK
jgi:TRAP-type C4-dicarboxylate transport system permease small subunit